MDITKEAQEYHEKMFPGYKSKFLETDPEFIERFDNFAFDEVVNEEGIELDQKTRELITFCFLYAQGGCEPQLISHAAANMRLVMDFLKCLIRQTDLYLVLRLRWKQRLLRA